MTYDGNGSTSGTPPIDPTIYAPGATVTVLGNTGGLTETGFVFSGWNTAANGSGTTYAPGSTFVMPSTNVVLYALWVPLSSPAMVPTLSEWGIILLALLTLGLGIESVRGRTH